MKLIESRPEALVFVLGRREFALLLTALHEFPPKRPKPPAITSHGAPPNDSAQAMLEESLDEHRREHAAALRAFLESGEHIAVAGTAIHFTLPRESVEWLLQMLNDVRVGSWELLGCPNPDEMKVTDETVMPCMLMETCAVFQMAVLAALEKSPS